MAVPVKNEYLKDIEVDQLYHLGLNSGQDLKAMFGDVKFVCMGGSSHRAEKFAKKLAKDLDLPIPVGCGIVPIGKTERYSLFKVGNIISVNHGMGMPTHSILLHEITKLLHYAGASDVVYMRIGTSGGLGVEGGTVVVASEAMSAELKPSFRSVSLGQVREFPTQFDSALTEKAHALAQGGDGVDAIPCVIGKTMGTDDFYEGQGRCDGAICEHDEAAKFEWLHKVAAAGVVNIEMEAPQFASFCLRMGIRAVLINAVLLNRLNGDQVDSTPEELSTISNNAQEVAIRLIRSLL